MTRSRGKRWVLFVLAVAVLGAGVGFGALSYMRKGETSPFLRGQAVASRLGCFACHGPQGIRGVVTFNPKPDEVPTWEPLTLSKFVKSRAEIKEWILNGFPERLRNDEGERARMKKQLIRMPSFEDDVTPEELEDLVAFIAAVGGVDLPESGPARRGHDIAEEFGCFGCHGAQGRGQMPNPGSFKGYIPAWDTADYPELVTSPLEFREWLLEGTPKRLREHPVAVKFLDAQVIKMPPYAEQLSPEQVDDIEAYIAWLRAAPPRAGGK